MHTDPIADLLTRIRNAANAHQQNVSVPHSKVKENILKVMKANNFVEDFETVKKGDYDFFDITLRENMRDITFKRVSKPGQRIYVKKEDLKPVKSGLGISILSTSKGVMSNGEARKQNLGGEIICEIY